MKKIMILYASVGGGHFRAAEGVKNYFEKNYSNDEIEVELIDGLNYVNELVDKIVIKSYVNMARYSPKTWSRIYKMGAEKHSLATLSNGAQKLLSTKLYELFEKYNPDLVVSTHFFLTEMVACLKRKNKTNAKLAVILTDYASHKFWESSHEQVDMYFCANEQMKYVLSNDGIDASKINVTGIPIRPEFLEKYDKSAVLSNLGLLPEIPTFLMFGGGQYGMSNISNIFSQLLQVDRNIQVVAIAGKSEKLQKSLSQIAEKSDKTVKVLGFSNNVHELMSACDFVISKPGGLTTTEVLVTNVPFIIINPVPGQEEENSNFLTNNGAAVRLWDTSKVKPFIENLLDDKFRIEQMKIMQRHIAKPDSTKNIAKILLENI